MTCDGQSMETQCFILPIKVWYHLHDIGVMEGLDGLGWRHEEQARHFSYCLIPLLFLIYTHELPDAVSRFGVTCKMHADDLKIYKIVKEDQD